MGDGFVKKQTDSICRRTRDNEERDCFSSSHLSVGTGKLV